MVLGTTLDCKIFWDQTFASFLERNFGLQFAEPGGIWRIRQITAEICRICQICQATLKIKLNCNCSSENSPIRRSSKMTLGNPTPKSLQNSSNPSQKSMGSLLGVGVLEDVDLMVRFYTDYNED